MVLLLQVMGAEGAPSPTRHLIAAAVTWWANATHIFSCISNMLLPLHFDDLWLEE